MEIKLVIAFFVSLACVMISMPSFIKYLKKLSLRQSVSEYALPDDQKKEGTPIMGGILFIVVPVIMTILLNQQLFSDTKVIVVIVTFIGYGCIGFIDDYLIAIKKDNEGLTPKKKLLLQLILAIIFFLFYRSKADLSLHIPLTDISIPLGWGYFFLIVFMFVGSSNALNLTDGMDGLSSGTTIIALIPFMILLLIKKEVNLAIFTISLIASLLGYLYYNKKPAQIFMGDTGALALGGVLAALAMVLKCELALIFIAGIPVIETLCVIIQITAVKTIGKRVFSYTPIHYAFRIKGMPETSIVMMFWMVEAILAAIGLFLALH